MSSWQMSHVCRWLPLGLPLNICSKLERNPGELAGLCAQLNTCHIFIFKGSKIDVRVHPHPPSRHIHSLHTSCEASTAW